MPRSVCDRTIFQEPKPGSQLMRSDARQRRITGEVVSLSLISFSPFFRLDFLVPDFEVPDSAGSESSLFESEATFLAPSEVIGQYQANHIVRKWAARLLKTISRRGPQATRRTPRKDGWAKRRQSSLGDPPPSWTSSESQITSPTTAVFPWPTALQPLYRRPLSGLGECQVSEAIGTAIIPWRSPVGVPAPQSGGLLKRVWQRLLRKCPFFTPDHKFTIASRGFQRGQG